MPKNPPLKPVIVRTYSAGVHFGYLAKQEGKEVMLHKSRRIWRWFGANTLNEISIHGLDISRSKVSETIEEITLTEAIEIIPCQPEAEKNLLEAKWNQ